ncbi:MAG: cob(I)yrinic acid a,c-diamide adenosyltransferase [Anaerolineae bacterium]|nr:cob(I)yrinic acid a,c-diamide adenosyltransferase [Anaerolineae bacterium]
MSIYTGTGDKGKTSLLSGERVSKADLRVEAYGDVDELNATLGALIASLSGSHAAPAPELQRIQADLFTIGAWLAATPGSPAAEMLVPLTPEYSRRIEKDIDRLEAELPRLTAFILPGGHPSAAWAHVARTVCRRAERHIVRLIEAANEYDIEPYRQIVIYLNRLSDELFVLARYLNKLAHIPDLEWRPQ